MKVRMPVTWKQLKSLRFNRDQIKREAVPFKSQKLEIILEDTEIHRQGQELHDWFVEQGNPSVKKSQVYRCWGDSGVFYFMGTSFVFEDPDVYIAFKLTFG